MHFKGKKATSRLILGTHHKFTREFVIENNHARQKGAPHLAEGVLDLVLPYLPPDPPPEDLALVDRLERHDEADERGEQRRRGDGRRSSEQHGWLPLAFDNAAFKA